MEEPGVKLHKGRNEDQKKGMRVFLSFGKTPSRLSEFGVTVLDGNKLKIHTEFLIRLIPRIFQLPEVSTIQKKVKVYVQPDSWIRAKCISDILKNSFNSEIYISANSQFPKEASLFPQMLNSDKTSDLLPDAILAPLDSKVGEAHSRVFYARCDSQKLEENVKNRIQEILDFREEATQKNFASEVESLIRLAVLRVRLSKRVEEKPDLVQLEFLLYQYARARHVLATMENEMKEKIDMGKIDWKDIHEYEEELALRNEELKRSLKPLA